MKRRRALRRLTSTLVVAAVAACSGLAARPAGADCHAAALAYKHGIVTFTEHGQVTQVRVEIADTEVTREFGLMCRASMDPDAGMLFVFAQTTQTPFWMENTLIPLSIAFIDAQWRVVGLMDMGVEPDPSNAKAIYTPPRPYRYALEVNRGFFAQHGIDADAEVRFSPQDAAQ